eukprot:3033466-Rhodomonas_salina.1
MQHARAASSSSSPAVPSDPAVVKEAAPYMKQVNSVAKLVDPSPLVLLALLSSSSFLFSLSASLPPSLSSSSLSSSFPSSSSAGGEGGSSSSRSKGAPGQAPTPIALVGGKNSSIICVCTSSTIAVAPYAQWRSGTELAGTMAGGY